MLEVAAVRLQFLTRSSGASVSYDPALVVPDPIVTLKVNLFEVTAEVDLTGDAGDAAGCRIGFAQIADGGSNRATYRGIEPKDGSSLVILDEPPALKQNTCRDSWNPYDAFTDPPGTTKFAVITTSAPGNLKLYDDVKFPRTVRLAFADAPYQAFKIKRLNQVTNEYNFIESAKLEFIFYTMLVMQKYGPTEHIEQLAYFRWTAKMEPEFNSKLANSYNATSISGSNSKAEFGPFVYGPVPDARFDMLLNQLKYDTCGDLSNFALSNPVVHDRML